jgi:hypothetical protein
MRRIPKLTPRFLARRKALGATRGALSRLIVREIEVHCRDPLPGRFDFETIMPPVSPRYWCRPIGSGLWLYYIFDDATVTLANLTNREPPLLDTD